MRLLLVEDNAADARVVKRRLKDAGLSQGHLRRGDHGR